MFLDMIDQNRQAWERSDNSAGAPNGNVHATYGRTPHISHRRDMSHTSKSQLLYAHGSLASKTTEGVSTQYTLERSDDHKEVLALQSVVLAGTPKANITLLRHIRDMHNGIVIQAPSIAST